MWLCFLLGRELSMANKTGKITKISYYHLRSLKQVWRLLSQEITACLVPTYVISRLDYCKFGASWIVMINGHTAEESAAYHHHNSQVARCLWTHCIGIIWATLVPVTFQIKYKLCLMMNMVHVGCCPHYITRLCHQLALLITPIPPACFINSLDSKLYQDIACILQKVLWN